MHIQCLHWVTISTMKHSSETGGTQDASQERVVIPEELFLKTQSLILQEMLGAKSEVSNDVLLKWIQVPGNADVSRAVTEEFLHEVKGRALSEEEIVQAAQELLVRGGGSTVLQ